MREPAPGPLPDQREKRAREDPCARHTTGAPDVVARRLAGVDSRELQRRVGLDGDGQVGRPFEPDRPRTVVAAPREQLVREQPVGLRVAQAEEVEQEEMLGGHRRVRLELALPPAVGVLQREQALRAELDGSVERCQFLDDSHAATLVVTSDNNLAAVRPERTALSIVAGQPVAVHAPARVTCGPLGQRAGTQRRGPWAKRDGRVRLAADPRPEQLGVTQPFGHLPRDPLDELAAAHLHQLRHAARDHGQILARARAGARESAAIEDPVRIRVEQRRQRRPQERPVEEEVDADDRRRLQLRLRLAEQARRFRGRGRNDDRIGGNVVDVVDSDTGLDLRAPAFERPQRRIAVHPAERLRRQHELARAQTRKQCGLHGEDAHRGARLRAGKVERRTDEDVPEPLDRPGRLALAEEEVRERLVVVLVRA